MSEQKRKPNKIRLSIRIEVAQDEMMRYVAKLKGLSISDAWRQAASEYVEKNRHLLPKKYRGEE
jgi:uncharacterized protein (DUF1778 family)